MAINKDNPFLKQAVDSILNQSYSKFEFIIIANGCSNELWEELNTYHDNRIKLHRLEMGGFAFSLNYGISVSSGKYIARMDADDISTSDRILTQVTYLESHPSISLISCACDFIDEENHIMTNRIFKIVEDDEQIRRALPYRNPILHAAMMVRRELLINVGGYKYGHMSEDHELYIRLARDCNIKFFNLNKVLYHYRRHADQATSIEKAKNNYYEIAAFLFSEFLRTKNIKYIIGILRVSPFVRKLYNWIKRR